MSSTPRPAARLTIPSASALRTIAGKMVTMSIFTALDLPRPRHQVQLDQPLGRIDHDAPRRRIDADADVVRERNLDLAALRIHHQPAPLHRPLDGAHLADQRVSGVAHLAANQLVM